MASMIITDTLTERKPMKRFRYIIVLFCFFTPLLCSADTIMVYMERNAVNIGTQPLKACSEAFEEGILTSLFDAGHIVFDAPIVDAASTPEGFSLQKEVVELARSGGADYILGVNASFIPLEAEDSVGFKEVMFVFQRIGAEEPVLRGIVRLEDLKSNKNLKNRALCYEIGKLVAAKVRSGR